MNIVINIPEELYNRYMNYTDNYVDFVFFGTEETIIKAIRKGTPLKKGYWKRMSDLSEDEDDRYECSHCGNVVHHRNKMNLYTFNSWCGRCGSNNGR